MPTLGDDTDRLSDLHDAYTWEVNAAIGEGREDLVAALVDDYLAEAMQEMSGSVRTSRSGGFLPLRRHKLHLIVSGSRHSDGSGGSAVARAKA